MSKMYVTSGTGSQQTLSDIQNEKIPIYDSQQDAESDLANLAEGQLVATKDNGNNNRYLLQSEYNSNNTYSTSEVNTGKTWIDGKPIYRKVFSGSLASGITIANDVDKLIAMGGHILNFSNYQETIPQDTCFLMVNTTNELIIYSPTTKTGVIWGEYTKTTD